jgi:hypothetical protein
VPPPHLVSKVHMKHSPEAAERKALFFPEEERIICKVEMEPALYGDVAVRVASAM